LLVRASKLSAVRTGWQVSLSIRADTFAILEE
jgi:hypothetical protein